MTVSQNDIDQIVAALQAGNPALAEQRCQRLLNENPAHEMCLLLLGVALQEQHQPLRASGVHEELTRLYPEKAEHWGNLGTTLREAGLHDAAEQACQMALRLAPEHAGLKANLGLLYKERGEYVKAKEYLVPAAEELRDDFELRICAATVCYTCGDNKGLARLIDDWRDWPSIDEDLRIDLAWLLAQIGQTVSAERLLSQSLRVNGKRVRTLAVMVNLLERINRLDEAGEILTQLPDPDTIDDPQEKQEVIGALGVMALRGRDPAVARALLERLLATVPNPELQDNLYFALAKACDKQGDTAAAMDALARAHAAQLRTAAGSVPDLLAPGAEPLEPALVRMTEAQAAQFPRQVHLAEGSWPLFIVGFPRSGTTMLEQMLDAHPSLVSMDEQPFLQVVAEHVQSSGLLYPEDLGRLDDGSCAALRRIYWDQVERVVKLRPGQHLVDKNPLNLLHLPLICRLFPDARIILALRHPCDVILSNYMQNFRSPGYQVLCSSLDRLAKGYVNGMQFWIHHEKLLHPCVLHLRYEDLLENFDTEVERIAAFIGIDDASPLRDFHGHAQRKGFISTPSYAQVTEPPNKSAVGRWHRYEDAFSSLLPILEGMMEHWGYVD